MKKFVFNLFFLFLLLFFFSCKVSSTFITKEESTHQNDSLEMWFFSGFLANTDNYYTHSLSCLLFRRRTFSAHIAVSDLVNKSYHYEIFNPRIEEETFSADSSVRISMRITNDLQDFHFKIRKKTYFLSAFSSEKKFFRMKLFCNSQKMTSINGHCSSILSDSLVFFVWNFEETEGKLSYHDRKAKIKGAWFYNRIYNTRYLLKNHHHFFLINVRTHNNGECVSIFAAYDTTHSDTVKLLSYCSSKNGPQHTSVQIKILAFWKSPKTQKVYPVNWAISVPSEKKILHISAIMENQEVQWMKNGYWMGAGAVKSVTEHSSEMGNATIIVF